MSDELPALLGGTAVRPEGPPAWPMADAAVSAAIQAAIVNGAWGQYHGPHVPRVETLLTESFSVSHAITCASGTLAVEIALRAVGVGPGDEVILGAYDYEPSFLAIHAIGALPTLVDVQASNVCIDLDRIEAAISPATKAILATHLHGGLATMTGLAQLASRRGIALIEDAAQVPGARVEGVPAGSRGDLGILSFGGSKLLTSGRGGAILCQRADLAQRVRLLLSRGVQQWGALSELQAIALEPQTQALPERTAHRQQQVDRLCAMLCDLPGLTPFDCGDTSAYYKLGFFLDPEAMGLSRERFVKALRAEGVAFDAGFRALHVGRARSRYRTSGPLPNAERAGNRVVILHHPVLGLGEAEVEQVAKAMWKTYRNAARLN